MTFSKILNLNRRLNEYVLRFPVVSFDIFDTIIIRRCEFPRNVFEFVERKYNEQFGLISHFCNDRILAESHVRKTSTLEEVTLEQIYRYLENYYSHEECEWLKSKEIEVEEEQCVANQMVADLYNELVDKKDVYIISDMYLPLDVIKKILEINGLKIPKKIYLSCELMKTKRSGSLFHFFMTQESLKAKDIVHIGDNIISDYLRPRQAGMHSYLFP